MSYTCQCDLGWAGTNCDQDADDCISNPCLNGATCTDTGLNSYECTCATGWTGSNCDINIDDCIGSNGQPVCKNGATCTDLLNDYSCTCATGWTGKDCDQDADDCISNPCQNGGTCTDTGLNSYECECEPDFGGVNCETTLTACEKDPCLNGGVCTNLPNGQLDPKSGLGRECDCDATIVDRLNPSRPDHSLTWSTRQCSAWFDSRINPNDNRCTQDGYKGHSCHKRFTVCDVKQGNPCKNGGRCRVHPSESWNHICYCTIDYWGHVCQYQARAIDDREVPIKFRQFLGPTQPKVSDVIRTDPYSNLNNNQLSRTVMAIINHYKIPDTHADFETLSDRLKRKFITFVLQTANERGEAITNLASIRATFQRKVDRGEITRRRLLEDLMYEASTEIALHFEFNSTDDDEVVDFGNAVLEPIDPSALAEKINEDSEFLDELYDGNAVNSSDLEQYNEAGDMNITFIHYIQDEEVFNTFDPDDDLPENPTAPNNSNDPEGNGYEPTTKARIVGNIKRRRSPYTGAAKTVQEVKDIITDLISNNPKRKQWSIAKKLAFAKKIKAKYLKN